MAVHVDEAIKSEFASLAEQIRKGFAANDKQLRVLKTRMAKMELELAALKRVENRRGEEIIELKSRKA
jgi:hypothetical protein